MVTDIFVIIDLAQSATKDFIFNVWERQFNAFDIDKTKIYHILTNIAYQTYMIVIKNQKQL